jgi:hypothetical protein
MISVNILVECKIAGVDTSQHRNEIDLRMRNSAGE